METIIIKLDSKKLENPDLDMIYTLPEEIEKFSNGKISDNGYDYLSQTEIGIWLETDNAENHYQLVIDLLKKKKFCNNDLSNSAQIWISSNEIAALETCHKVYPI